MVAVYNTALSYDRSQCTDAPAPHDIASRTGTNVRHIRGEQGRMFGDVAGFHL
jgi:hypothetical protein